MRIRTHHLSAAVLSLTMTAMLAAPTLGWADSARSVERPDAAKAFETLKQKGVLEGYEDGSAGLDRPMTRAEFAAVLVRLLKLQPKTGTPSYTDTGGHWAQQQGYIEAVTAAKMMEGTSDRTFDPEGKVTLEQLAATLVRGLGLMPAAEADASAVGPTSEWAAGYVATALQEKLLGPYPDYTGVATREALTLSLAAADDKLAALAAANSGPLSITEFKATGAKKLHVQWTRPAEPDKISFVVKRSGTPVEGKATVQDNGQGADIVFNAPLPAGNYSVELKGLDPADAGKTTAEAAVEQEKLVSIDFATAGDTLPRARNAYVAFRALNQYGEAASFSSGQFEINTGRTSYTAVPGEQAIKLDLTDQETNDRVAVSILHSGTGLSAQKTFTVGDLPLVTRIEAGEIRFPGSVQKLISGSSAYLQIRAFDQYGIPVMAVDETDKDGKAYGLNTPSGVHVTAKDSSILTIEDNPWFDEDGDGFPELKIGGGIDADQARESEITLYALGSSQSVTKKLALSVVKSPFSVQFADFSKTVAVGDKNVVLPLIVKDDQGAALTSNEIALGADQLDVYDTFGSGADVRLDSQGKLIISGLKEGSGTVTVRLQGTDKQATLNLNVQKERYPAQFMLKTDLAPIYVQDAEESLVVLIKDQYGDLIRDASNEYIAALADDTDATKVRKDAEYKLHASFTNTGKPADNGAFYPTAGPLKTALDALRKSNPSPDGERERELIDETFQQPEAGNTYGLNIGNIYNSKLTFRADANKTGTYQLTLTLVKVENDKGSSKVEELARLTRTVEVIDGTQSDIAYDVKLDTAVNNTLFAAVDAYREKRIDDATVTVSAYGVAQDRIKLAKEVVLSAKKGGQAVQLPSYWLNSAAGAITSSNPSVASAVYVNSGTPAVPNYKYFVIGDKEGSATITTIFRTAGGSKTARLDMKTSEQPLDIAKTSVPKAYAETSYAKLTGKKIWDYSLMGEVSVIDQYGSAYKNDAMATHVKALNLMFYVKDIVYKTADGNDTVSVDPNTGVLAYTGDGDMAGFTVVIEAPNGKQLQTIVHLK
ncbi:S-layer homology domain-containing protein [Paenibacillus doosanensis]|uniref:S-layer homology domain-containing protein n=1 Tax=Paenibacillus doosanensis TaxID=1229154 RepID=UPI00217FAAB3|nr:S-layer homology domain-containing protein [Paenibacillus doosanensis]MCS7459166.1 S-layer homology domain-containing protein [Paenibacillus doosanensis]